MITTPFTWEEDHRNVHTVRFEINEAVGWEQYFLLQMDEHFDNVHCQRDLLKKHHEQAVARNAGIFKFGDVFCAMQGKWDKRADQNQMRDEHRVNNYLDKLVETASDWYSPFANNILLVTPGNHETSILKHHQSNLTERLVQSLKTRNQKVALGGYSGWVRFMFTLHGGRRMSYKLFYHHGYGGGGPVTRGVIQTNRQAVYLPDAHFVVSGHTHDEWIMPIQRTRLSDAGKPYQDEQLHIKGPGYKDEYADGYDGYHIEGGRPPKPTGGVWLRFYYEDREIRYEALRAK